MVESEIHDVGWNQHVGRWLVDDDEQDVLDHWLGASWRQAEAIQECQLPVSEDNTRECQLPASKDKLSAGQVEVSMATHRAFNQGQPLGLQSWPTTAESRKRMGQPLDGLTLGGPIVSKRIEEPSSWRTNRFEGG